MDNEQRIRQAFCGVDYSQKEELLQVSKELKDIPKKEIIDYLAKISKRWQNCDLPYYVKIIEEAFGARFDHEQLIKMYFEEPEFWNKDYTEMLEDFNQITGREVSANDVAKIISIDFVRKSIRFDVGVLGFIEFICDNGGDAGSFVKRIISNTDDLDQQEISDVVCMADYIDGIDSADVEKLFRNVDWDIVKEEEETEEEYATFLKKFAPALMSQMA